MLGPLCPTCAAAGRTIELLALAHKTTCPRCNATWLPLIPPVLCDACGRRGWALKWRGLRWCVECFFKS